MGWDSLKGEWAKAIFLLFLCPIQPGLFWGLERPQCNWQLWDLSILWHPVSGALWATVLSWTYAVLQPCPDTPLLLPASPPISEFARRSSGCNLMAIFCTSCTRGFLPQPDMELIQCVYAALVLLYIIKGLERGWRIHPWYLPLWDSCKPRHSLSPSVGHLELSCRSCITFMFGLKTDSSLKEQSGFPPNLYFTSEQDFTFQNFQDIYLLEDWKKLCFKNTKYK